MWPFHAYAESGVSLDPLEPDDYKVPDAYSLVRRRHSLERFKATVLDRQNHTCAICGTAVREVLDVAHISSYSSDTKNRANPGNGIGLCSYCHRADGRSHQSTELASGQPYCYISDTLSAETIVPCGGMTANALGLTTQVPVRSVYLTSGVNRELRFGGKTVELRNAPRWQLAAPHRPAGEAVRALAWLGPEAVEDNLRALECRLSAEDMRELAASRAVMPAWMAQPVSATVADGMSRTA